MAVALATFRLDICFDCRTITGLRRDRLGIGAKTPA